MKAHVFQYPFSVAAGVPPAAEPGILPDGKSSRRRHKLCVQRRHSGRRDSANLFSFRSAAVLGSSNGSTATTQERYVISPARNADAPEDERTPCPLQWAVRLCATLVLLLATGLVAQAQSTNTVARPDYQSFKIITDRNIFDPNRSSRSSRSRTEGPRPARVESFALVGTMSYENGTYAFFDGTGSSYRKAVKTGDTIAGHKVADISADRVKLEVNGQQIELSVGVQMRKQDEGEWQLAGRAESFVTSSPAAATSEKTDNASGGEESDVLKKLMQKREQELK